MAQNFYVWIKGQIVGDVIGESTVSSLGRENSIEGHQFEHRVQIHREASGMATGERSHDPITITKRVDKSSPILHQALCQNDELEVTFKFFRPDLGGAGTEEHFYTIELNRGRISAIKTINANPFDDRSPPMMEEVSFVFEKITWTYESGGITYIDEWSVA